jgi:hypothetical protein
MLRYTFLVGGSKKQHKMNTKYKFVETDGCTAFDFTVNDKSVGDMSEQEYNEMLEYLFVKIKEGIDEQEVRFRDLVSLFQHDEYEYDSEPCEQCGDTVTTTTWNI